MPTKAQAPFKKGKIYLVGTGPGSIEHMTPYAQRAIRESDVVVGYKTYLHLIEEIVKGKEIVSTGMTQETERCQMAIELAGKGKTVAVISGGDPGIYAMAGLVFELLRTKMDRTGRVGGKSPQQERPDLEIEVIPGVSALNACAARLGAPIMHDFASISLSDRLTPWELIEKRLEAASGGDFVIVLYNPKSAGRSEHLARARDIILRYKNPATPVGIVKGAGREDERIVITDLENLTNYEVDMQTTVIIGNSETFVWHDWMVTPRGYRMEDG